MKNFIKNSILQRYHLHIIGFLALGANIVSFTIRKMQLTDWGLLWFIPIGLFCLIIACTIEWLQGVFRKGNEWSWMDVNLSIITGVIGGGIVYYFGIFESQYSFNKGLLIGMLLMELTSVYRASNKK